MTDKKNGREYLAYVTEKLENRIRRINLSIEEGQKEIEGSTATKSSIISRRFLARSAPMRNSSG